jgi:ribonuclease T2
VPPYTGEPIEGWFEGYGKLDLLAYMKKFWLGLNQSSWILWAHEYSKHATCFSSFQTECFVRSHQTPRGHMGLFESWD